MPVLRQSVLPVAWRRLVPGPDYAALTRCSWVAAALQGCALQQELLEDTLKELRIKGQQVRGTGTCHHSLLPASTSEGCGGLVGWLCLTAWCDGGCGMFVGPPASAAPSWLHPNLNGPTLQIHKVATTMCDALGACQVWERRTQEVAFRTSLVPPTSRHRITAWRGVQCSPACTQAVLREHPTDRHDCTHRAHRRTSCASRSGGGTDS
jgi:hypothetical protein